MIKAPLQADLINRRYFMSRTSTGLGVAGLASLLANDSMAADPNFHERNRVGGIAGLPHFPARIKRVIYLFQSGGPAQMDLYLSLIHI